MRRLRFILAGGCLAVGSLLLGLLIAALAHNVPWPLLREAMLAGGFVAASLLCVGLMVLPEKQ